MINISTLDFNNQASVRAALETVVNKRNYHILSRLFVLDPLVYNRTIEYILTYRLRVQDIAELTAVSDLLMTAKLDEIDELSYTFHSVRGQLNPDSEFDYIKYLMETLDMNAITREWVFHSNQHNHIDTTQLIMNVNIGRLDLFNGSYVNEDDFETLYIDKVRKTVLQELGALSYSEYMPTTKEAFMNLIPDRTADNAVDAIFGRIYDEVFAQRGIMELLDNTADEWKIFYSYHKSHSPFSYGHEFINDILNFTVPNETAVLFLKKSAIDLAKNGVPYEISDMDSLLAEVNSLNFRRFMSNKLTFSKTVMTLRKNFLNELGSTNTYLEEDFLAAIEILEDTIRKLSNVIERTVYHSKRHLKVFK